MTVEQSLPESARAPSEEPAPRAEQEEIRRHLFGTSPLPIVIMDPVTRRFIDCNPAAATIYGFPDVESTLGREPRDVSAPLQYDGSSSPERAIEHIQRALHEGSVTFEWLHQRPNGERWDAEVHLTRFCVGPHAYLQFTLIDITERLRAQRALRASEARYRYITENTRDVIWILDIETLRFLYVSPSVEKLRGYTPEEILAAPMDAALTPEAAARVRAMLEQRAARLRAGIQDSDTEVAYTEDIPQPCKDGSIVWTEVLTVYRRNPSNGRLEVHGVTRDISKRTRAEEALKLSQARLEMAQAQAKIGSWEYSHATGEAYWSRQLYVLYGLDPEQGVPSPERVMEAVHPEDRSMVYGAPNLAIASGLPHHHVHRTNPSHGSVRYLEVTIVPHFDEQGRFCRLTGTTQDVTEREHAAQKLRDSEQRLHRLLHNSNDLIAVLDRDGRFCSLRGPFGPMLGYVPEELEGHYCTDRVHPDDVSEVRRVLSETMVHPGVAYRVELRYRHRQGGWVDMEAVGTNWLGDPTINGVVVNLRQTTERKRAELERAKLQSQLQQTSKMEAIGRLAGGVAHDFNNLLTVISGNVELALSELGPADPLVQFLTEIDKASSSASSLTRQLLAFSRRQLIEPKVVDLNALVRSLHKMLLRLIGEDISLELRLSDELGSVRIDAGQFDQVLVNLAVNARDAMPSGGRLTIETDNIELDEQYCGIHNGPKPGHFVRLVVTDNGEGMTPEVLSRVFEPFFTTKSQGAGTGLGLSVIFGVVKQVGGTIEAYSEPGHGTTFKIYLPRVDEPAQELARATAPLEVLRGNETVLLVEDNDSVRDLTANMLRRLGYRLFVASSGKHALALVASEQPEVDLLFTDVVMPGMSGRELSERIRETYPRAAILYCSGYTEDTFLRHGLASEHLQFIGKPFTLQQLGLKLRQLLDERRKNRSST